MKDVMNDVLLDRMITALSAVKPSRVETTLHLRIGDALFAENISFQREVKLDGGIVDFLVEGRVAVEVKTAGSINPALSQLHRYMKNAEVKSGILLTTRPWAPTNFPTELEGKKIHLIRIWKSAL